MRRNIAQYGDYGKPERYVSYAGRKAVSAFLEQIPRLIEKFKANLQSQKEG